MKTFLQKTIYFAFLMMIGLGINQTATAATYYSKATGNPATLGTWGLALNGTGTAPTNFTTVGDIFILRSAATLDAAANNDVWVIGTGVTLQIDGTLAISGNNATVTINGTVIFTNSSATQVTLAGNGSGNIFDVAAAATLKTSNINGIQGTNCSLPSNATKQTVTLATNANYEFNGTAAQSTLGLPILTTGGSLLISNTSAEVSLTAAYTIATGVTVTVNSGSSLRSAFAITNNGTLTIKSNANLIQTGAGANPVGTGVTNVERNSSPLFRLDYTLWSSPVSGTQTLGQFSPLTLSTRFYQYNTSTDLYNAVPQTTPFSQAKGYLIRMPDNSTPFPGTAASWAGTFTGTTPNSGNITFIMSTALNGFNAVGNPYPSTLSMDNFINGNLANITGPLYFWRKTNDDVNPTSYSTCTTAGCSLNNGHTYANTDFISVGQGFIVKATTTTLNFTNSMRVSNNQNQFFKTKQIEKNRIWLNLSKDAKPVNQMLLAYMTGATEGIDPAIDGRYINDSQTALNSFLNNEEFAIQGRALPFEATDVVPLAFKTTTDGNYTIALDRVDGLFLGNQDVYLVDSNRDIETNLKTSSYSFTATAGVDNGRFSLTFQKTLKVDASVFNDKSVIVYKNNGVIYVNSGAKLMNNIKVFDIQGRLIAERNNVKANTTSIQNLKANNQVLIVKVTTDDNLEISKKVEN